MKLWKTILLQAGIFTSVFALGATSGFFICYRKAEDKKPATRIVAQEPSEVQPIEETPADKFLSNLASSRALEGSIDLSISLNKPEQAEFTTRALDINDLGDIDLSITDLQISISDLTNIKVAGDIEVKTGPLDMKLSLGYFDNTIYLDYLDNYFYLKTSDITDVMQMIPTVGESITLPSEFQNLDFDSLISSLTNMEEHIEEDEHYFLFNFSEDIQIKFLSDETYHMVGVELPQTSLMGMNISATSDLHCLYEDIEDLVNPSIKDGAPKYVEFKPAFNLVNNVISLVNEKKARVAYSVDIDRTQEGVVGNYFDLEGNLDFDIDQLKLFTDVTVHENDRTHTLSAGYQDDTAFLSFRNLNLSIEKQSIFGLVDYISSKVSNDDKVQEVMNQLGNVTNELNIAKILAIVNDLPEFVHNFELTNDKLSLDFDPSYFGLPVGEFNLAISFDEDSINNVTIRGLSFNEFTVNASLDLLPYVEVEINPSSYVKIDPALSLIDGVEKLINQNKFGIAFSINMDDGDQSTTDLSMFGNFQFSLKQNEEADEDTPFLKQRLFDYGSGKLTIVDSDSYAHRIKVDAQSKGNVLLEYNDKVHAKFNNETVDNIVKLATKLYNEKDDHFMELFGNLLDEAKTMPINEILNGDYGMLLETEIITNLDVTANQVVVGLTGALIGKDDMDFTVTIRYNENEIEGVDISNLVFGGKTISLSATLFEFDQEVYEYCLLDENAYNYIDLSTLSVLLELGLNTSEFNYYHFNGTIDIQIPINLGLIQTEIKKTIKSDVKILNDKGRVKVYAELKEIPIVAVVSDGVLKGYDYRNAYLMFDSATDTFHIYRHDHRDKGFLQSELNDYTYRKCQTQFFLENIMTIMMKDILGLSNTITNAVSNIESSDEQIIYENIINDYHYDSNAGSYFFAINLDEIAHTDKLGVLSLTIFEGSGTFADKLERVRIVLDITPGLGITMHADLDMSLQSDCDTSISGHELTAMDNWVNAHANDEMNKLYTA